MTSKIVARLSDSPVENLNVAIVFAAPNLSVVAEREQADGSSARDTLVFAQTSLYRFVGESLGRGFPQQAYDAVIEIEPSEWADRERRFAQEQRRSTPPLNHYAIYLTDHGFLEVLAESVEHR